MSTQPSAVLALMLSNTYTVSDMYRRTGLLRQCVESALFTKTEKPFVQECVDCLVLSESDNDAKAVAKWGESVFTSFTQGNLNTKIHELHSEVDALPVLTLYIPVSFPDDEIASIGDWSRSNFDSAVLLDVHIEPSTVGGCAVVWNDIYHDLSFKTRMQDHRELITDILSSYAKK